MNGYFITASTTTAQMRPIKSGRGQTGSQLDVHSGRSTFMACADTLDDAQKLFDAGVAALRDGENPVETRVHEIMAAQLVGELLTESGGVPLDWPQIARQAVADVESTPADYMEQGNWVDDGTLNRVQGAPSNVEELRAALPADTGEGLNWQADKQFFFLFSVLSPLPPPSEPVEETEEPVAEPVPDAASDSGMEETTGEFSFERYLENARYPKLAPMETAVLVRARNSAVAAWLWKKYAVDTRLAANQIQLEGWGGVTGVNV